MTCEPSQFSTMITFTRGELNASKESKSKAGDWIVPAWQTQKKYAEEYSKYYKELANSIRTRGDAWGKAALGIGTAVLAAVGIGNIANLFSVRDFEILQLIPFVGIVVSGIGVYIVSRQLALVNEPLIMSANPLAIQTLRSKRWFQGRGLKSEGDLVRGAYARFASLNWHEEAQEGMVPLQRRALFLELAASRRAMGLDLAEKDLEIKAIEDHIVRFQRCEGADATVADEPSGATSSSRRQTSAVPSPSGGSEKNSETEAITDLIDSRLDLRLNAIDDRLGMLERSGIETDDTKFDCQGLGAEANKWLDYAIADPGRTAKLAALFQAELNATMDRAKALVVRQRMVQATTGGLTIVGIALIIVGLYGALVAADWVSGAESADYSVHKTCAEMVAQAKAGGYTFGEDVLSECGFTSTAPVSDTTSPAATGSTQGP